jgi:ribonucleoside-diphosphate reductase alpha chain
MKIKKITDNKDLKDTWDIEVDEVHEYLLSNGCVSHNTSGKSINAIESIEPIHMFFYKEEGTITVPTLVPNFSLNNQYYKRAFDCDQYALLENAAVRQKWIDQSQSVNIYIKKPDSFKELTDLHLYAFDIGLKTLYYFKQEKEQDQEGECESCT